MNFSDSRRGGTDVIHANMGVIHYLPVPNRLLFVLQFGSQPVGSQKSGATNVDLRGQVLRLPPQHIEIGQAGAGSPLDHGIDSWQHQILKPGFTSEKILLTRLKNIFSSHNFIELAF
jgi:hypothetical protein